MTDECSYKAIDKIERTYGDDHMQSSDLPNWMKWVQSGATISIPIVLAVIGGCVQKNIASASTLGQYVALAISILKEPARSKDEPLRFWAGDLLQQNSEVKMSDGMLAKIKAGEITLSGIAIASGVTDISIVP